MIVTDSIEWPGFEVTSANSAAWIYRQVLNRDELLYNLRLKFNAAEFCKITPSAVLDANEGKIVDFFEAFAAGLNHAPRQLHVSVFSSPRKLGVEDINAGILDGSPCSAYVSDLLAFPRYPAAVVLEVTNLTHLMSRPLHFIKRLGTPTRIAHLPHVTLFNDNSRCNSASTMLQILPPDTKFPDYTFEWFLRYFLGVQGQDIRVMLSQEKFRQ